MIRLKKEPGLLQQKPISPSLYWLGQAGFWLDLPSIKILIDPYLSNSLATKYAGTRFPHQRMVPPPLAVCDLPKPDLVLITHAHTDHMDPETLAPLANRFPKLSFMVPQAKLDVAKERIGDNANFIPVDAGRVIDIGERTTITVFPASHEKIDLNPEGLHPYLGYGISSDNLRIFHPGDTILFPELEERVSKFQPDIALLPVNGRDQHRSENGIPGNMSLEEAISFCQRINISTMVAHHFGMFDFNTIDPALIERQANQSDKLEILRPDIGRIYSISKY